MNKRGFTLVELLIVMAIMLVLAGVTTVAVRSLADGDRVRGGARLLQSALEGCKTRAAHSRQVRGLRFHRDDSDPRLVSSVEFVGESQPWNRGVITVGGPGWEQFADDERKVVRGDGTGWENLVARGLLRDNSQVTIRRAVPYAADVSLLSHGVRDEEDREILLLHTPFTGELSGTTEREYAIRLEPTPLPNETPILLPQNVGVDMVRSAVPVGFLDGPYFDILFTSRGTVDMVDTYMFLIHLVVRDVADIQEGRTFGLAQHDQRIVSIAPLAGLVSTHPLRMTDLSGNGEPDDPFRYGETGGN